MKYMDMKYFTISYTVKGMIREVFDYVVDVVRLHEELKWFGKGKLATNDLSPTSIGKKYTVLVGASGDSVETTIEVIKIDPPHSIEMSYNYRTLKRNGSSKDGCLLPWESMRCVLDFKESNGKTTVTTNMYANGVDSLWKRVMTRIFSYINWLQQWSAVNRIKNRIESTI